MKCGEEYTVKKTPCWLWHAINHENGEIIAFVLGTKKHDMLRKLYTLLCNLNLDITCVYSDNNFAYHDVIPSNILRICIHKFDIDRMEIWIKRELGSRTRAT